MRNFFATLNKITIQMSNHLCFNKSQSSLYEYIRAASVGWRKLGAKVSLDDMFHSNIKLQLPKVSVSVSRIYAARAELIDLQVIILKEDVYYLNFPLILRVLCYTYGEELRDAQAYYNEINGIYQVVTKEFLSNNIIMEVTPLPTCEEIFNRLPKKVKSKKALSLIPGNNPLTVKSLFNKFIQIFREYGISVYPSLMEADPATMNVEIGCLKGFISKYKGREEFLYKLFKEAAINWTFLCKEAEKKNLKQFIFGQADIIILYQNHDFILSSLQRNLNLLREGTHEGH